MDDSSIGQEHRRCDVAASMALPPAIDLAAWQATEHDPSVLIADGHDIRIMVRNGQLSVTDGPPGQRRVRTVAKVPRTVSRLLVLAGHGLVSVEAIRWLNWSGIPWSAHDFPSGDTIAVSGYPEHDARLLRAQATAAQTSTGLAVMRHLIAAKLEGQAANLRFFSAAVASDDIAKAVTDVERARTLEAIRGIEGNAAATYWEAWATHISVPFSPHDMLKVAPHWLAFDGRPSLSYEQSRNRNATDPANACLNYAYKIGETVAVQACHATGLHPALGISHADKQGRDSMALDLLEAIRPDIDRIVLSLLSADGEIAYDHGKPAYFDRRWIHETRDGVVQLCAPLTHRIASHAASLADQLAPHAEKVALLIADGKASPRRADGRKGAIRR